MGAVRRRQWADRIVDGNDCETGIPVDVLRTLAGISDPANQHLFTAESARRAYAGVKVHPIAE
jgi:hypothetical protein